MQMTYRNPLADLTRLPSQQDHLVCFLGGSILLGVTDGRGPVPPNIAAFNDEEHDDYKVGQGLIRGCVDTYTSTATGLAPEVCSLSLPTPLHLCYRFIS